MIGKKLKIVRGKHQLGDLKNTNNIKGRQIE